MSDHPSEEIVHRTLDTSGDEPVVQIVNIVADLEGKQPEDLTIAFEHLDHVIDYIFSNPPVPEAQVQITFSYEGYRITVEQNGSAKFARIS